MPKNITDMSVVELENALSLKRNKLQQLSSQRERLQKELNRVEDKIQSLGGTAGGGRGGRRGKRVKNAMPLSGYVEEILGRTKKGFTLDEIEQKIKDSKYKTKSKNFRNVIYQCLYHSENIVKEEETGRFQLKS